MCGKVESKGRQGQGEKQNPFFFFGRPKDVGQCEKKRRKLEGCREVGERELSMRRERRDSGDDAKALLEWIGGR